MTDVHHVLIVEDDPAMAEELRRLVDGLGFTADIVDNQHDAISTVSRRSFCLILLDLSIKTRPDSIAGHTEAGFAVLADVRKRWPSLVDGSRFHQFPVIVVSGHVRDSDDGFRALEAGADEVLPKPLNEKRGTPAEKIRRCLRNSGRETHSSCPTPATPPRALAGAPQILILVSGERKKSRNGVTVAARRTSLTDGDLYTLLSLWLARLNGEYFDRSKILDRKADPGYEGISRLRTALRDLVPEGLDVVISHHNNEYELNPCITLQIGEASYDKLAAHVVPRIREAAQRLRLHMAK